MCRPWKGAWLSRWPSSRPARRPAKVMREGCVPGAVRGHLGVEPTNVAPSPNPEGSHEGLRKEFDGELFRGDRVEGALGRERGTGRGGRLKHREGLLMVAAIVEVDPQLAVIMNGVAADGHAAFRGADENAVLFDLGDVVGGDERVERVTRCQSTVPRRRRNASELGDPIGRETNRVTLDYRVVNIAVDRGYGNGHAEDLAIKMVDANGPEAGDEIATDRRAPWRRGPQLLRGRFVAGSAPCRRQSYRYSCLPRVCLRYRRC